MFYPKLKDKYHVEHVPDEGFFLLAEGETFVLEGHHLMPIVPLLDGTRSVDQIVAAVSPFIQPADAIRVLEVLQHAGHLTEGDAHTPAAFGAFWSELNTDSRTVRAFLANCAVQISAIGSVDASPLAGIMASFGVRSDVRGVARVALVDDYLRPELAQLNRECLADRMPLLLVKPVGIRLWIGPLLLPNRTACWRCIESRLRGNREVESYVERKTGHCQPFPVARARLGITEYQAASMAAVQLIRWLVTGSNPSIESRMLVADVTSFSFSFHDIVRRPQCPDCGNPSIGARAGAAVSINGNGKENGISRESQGGVRSESPESTFFRLQHHVSPYTGIVNAVNPSMWHGAGPLRVYTAGHNFALKSDHLLFLKDGLRTHSSGKGKTDAQARTSALCEALERYSGVFRGDEPRVTGSYAELGEAAIDPRTCMLYSERQYAQREQWLARGSRFQIVPLAFDESARIEWTPLWSLTGQRQRLLPTSYLFYNHPTPPDHFFCWADSNGAAAGKTLEEAMLQGLLELVERDAVAIWWYNRIVRRGVDLDAFADDFFSEVQTFYRGRDRDVWVLDITSDFGIPVCVAISRRNRGPTEDIMMGFGAHFDPRIALTRAVTELNQFIPALLNVAPDGTTIYAFGDLESFHWWKTATIADQPYLLPATAAGVTAAEYPSYAEEGPAELLKRLIAILQAKGHEVLLLDQTRPDIELPVVKMVVPGLRHFWARYAPGRLYDVPVAAGWLQRPLIEDELNPTAMFL
ncbi:MAG: oxazoline/thiazoline synthase [Thermoanaerobaculia bacterium]|jgi:ribosomal protein S12 methylthiotransferase accessory factor|nr:oxazoline/thiazoline synthase [Thermoanaerobaculia bacterium]